MQFLFAATLFLSAFLLFLVQPLVGKMLLPLVGGTPAAWNACMVFFQAALLAGYAYAHAGSARFGRRLVVPHLVVLALPLLVLPIALREGSFRNAGSSDYPIFLILAQLMLAVGLPFFVVSTTGPLLQRWFADTGHAAARDPYFLYAASNLGSMLALLAYPALFEPAFALPDQSRVWAAGYVVYALLVAVCAVAMWRTKTFSPQQSKVSVHHEPRPSWKRRVRWAFLAFVPSSLLLGTTTYISTDIAPIPLLWVAPLALYLLTFILVFAKRQVLPHALANRLLPIALLMLTLVLLTGATELRGLPVGVLLVLHLAAFFLAALVGHGELARDRPAADHLTEFYLWMSVGGVLGGLFNALLAPVLFHKTGLTEYPFAIVLACLLLKPRTAPLSGHPRAPAVSSEAGASGWPPNGNGWDVLAAIGAGVLTVSLIFIAAWCKMEVGPLRTGVMFGLPCVLVYTFVDRPIRYALGLAALLLAGAINPDQRLRHLERNFFGVLKVAEVEEKEGGRFRVLFHGNTIHGQQNLDTLDEDGRHEPLTYYHRKGPIGQVFDNWLKPKPAGQRVAAVGLGTGSLAYYARPGDAWTFFEIDPAIQRVAENPEYFSFLSECQADSRDVILGDARLKLQDAAGTFDLIVLDAFSSDSIPMHLITREAVELYRERLAPGGLIAFHISNRYLNLRPILGKLAEATRLSARGWDDPTDDLAIGKLKSQWLMLAKREADFAPLAADRRWEPVLPAAQTPLWTDGFSNLLSAVEW